MKPSFRKEIIEMFNQYSCFIDRDGYITVGLCIEQGIADRRIPRSENKWQIDYERDKEKFANSIISLLIKWVEGKEKNEIKEICGWSYNEALADLKDYLKK